MRLLSARMASGIIISIDGNWRRCNVPLAFSLGRDAVTGLLIARLFTTAPRT